jgi:cyanophycin synthetase
MTSAIGGTGPMRVLETAVYRGPHLYSSRPMIRLQLDLGALEQWPTDRLHGFADALLARLPGLSRHGCCYGEPGGFVQRLREGTWLGHVIEHVAIELQSAAGAPVTRGKTRSVRGRPGVYNVMYAWTDEEAALLAGRLAIELVLGLLTPDLRAVEGLDRIARRAAPFHG